MFEKKSEVRGTLHPLRNEKFGQRDPSTLSRYFQLKSLINKRVERLCERIAFIIDVNDGRIRAANVAMVGSLAICYCENDLPRGTQRTRKR